MGEIVDKKVLTGPQAASLLEQIKKAAGSLCLLLVEMHDGKGWKALNYKTWGDFCQTEFQGYTTRYINCLVAQGRVSQQVGTIVPESHARELAKLPAEDQQGALEETKERCGENVTAGQIRETVDTWKAAEEPYVEPEEQEEPEPEPPSKPEVLRGFAAAGREALGTVLSRHDGDPVASALKSLASALRKHQDTPVAMVASLLDAWAVDIEDGAF